MKISHPCWIWKRKGAYEGCEGSGVEAASECSVCRSILERPQLCQIMLFKVRHFSRRGQELDVVWGTFHLCSCMGGEKDPDVSTGTQTITNTVRL